MPLTLLAVTSLFTSFKPVSEEDVRALITKAPIKCWKLVSAADLLLVELTSIFESQSILTLTLTPLFAVVSISTVLEILCTSSLLVAVAVLLLLELASIFQSQCVFTLTPLFAVASTVTVFKLLNTLAPLAAAVTLLQLELTFKGALAVPEKALTLKSLKVLGPPFAAVTDPVNVILLFTGLRSLESILLFTSKLAAGPSTAEAALLLQLTLFTSISLPASCDGVFSTRRVSMLAGLTGLLTDPTLEKSISLFESSEIPEKTLQPSK